MYNNDEIRIIDSHSSNSMKTEKLISVSYQRNLTHLMKHEDQYRSHTRSPLLLSLSQINPIHIFPSY